MARLTAKLQNPKRYGIIVSRAKSLNSYKKSHDMEKVHNQNRLILLNALPLNALPRKQLTLTIRPIAIQELIALMREGGFEIVNFIRHSSTLEALGIQLTPNSGLYKYEPHDKIIVVTLKTPQRGQEAQNVKPEDLEIWQVEVKE